VVVVVVLICQNNSILIDLFTPPPLSLSFFSLSLKLGGKATLLTLECKNAVDVSPLSFYPHEAESLLLPGTQVSNQEEIKEQ
jgi:hypothetical protein